MRWIAAVILLSIAVAGFFEWRAARPDIIEGTARVVDGDTLRVEQQSLRLLGYDAPELKQQCRDGSACGKLARQYLEGLLSGHLIKCRADQRDRYRRALAFCTIDTGNGRVDVNAAMVRAGWGVIDPRFPSDYGAQMRAAKRANVGIHALGGVKSPADFRDEGDHSIMDRILRFFFSKMQKG